MAAHVYDLNTKRGMCLIIKHEKHLRLDFKHVGPYSQRDFKPRLTKHDFNDFSIGDKIDT